MNIYLIGILIAMFLFIVIGVMAGRSVKDTNDYYVAGRRAPVILIVGSLIASFLSIVLMVHMTTVSSNRSIKSIS